MGAWNGEERRKERRDHDVLTRIDANLSNFMSRFDEHISDDKEGFDKINARASRLEKFMWIVSGGILVIEFLSKFWK